MKEILRKNKPQSWDTFAASNGWLSNFKKRYRISAQRVNNKKNVPITEKIPLMKVFHRWFLKDVQMRLPQRCPIYGRFPAQYMFHMVHGAPLALPLFSLEGLFLSLSLACSLALN